MSNEDIAVIKALNAIHEIFTDGMRKELNVPEDWRYFSTTLTLEDYGRFVEYAGSDNLKFVSGTHMKQVVSEKLENAGKEEIVRFSTFISPIGVKNLSERLGKEIPDEH